MALKIIEMSKKFSIKECFEVFKTECLLRGLSSQTVKWYDDAIKFFSKFYDLDNSISSVDENIVMNYISYCLSNGNKKATINTRLIALKSFFSWSYRKGFIEKKLNITLLKDVIKVKETYTKIELEKLLKKPDLKKCSFTEYRDWVISNFLLSLAPRVSTLINIKIKDLDLYSQELLYSHTKNKKQQIVPLTKYITNVLKEYLIYRKGSEDDFLFCTIYGQQLTSNALRISLNKYNRRRGVSRTGRHIYRNTFAKIWLNNGGDAFRLQKILSHSTLEMTKRYVEMYSDDLKNNFENLNPINSIITQKRMYIKIK